MAALLVFSLVLSSLQSFAAGVPVLVERSAASAICTNWNMSYKLTAITAPTRGFSAVPAGGQEWNINIDDSSAGHKQAITGFGAAVTDATVSTFNSLSSSTLSKLLGTLVTPSGANFNLMRHTIGSSDLTPDGAAYSYDDSSAPDTSLSKFALGSKGTAMANLLASMKKQNSNMKILGSSWSPPGWMKTNQALMGNLTNNNLSDRYLDSSQTDYSTAFANYFVKYIQAFNKLGANVDAITIQNEPVWSTAGYPSMYMYDYEQGNLIQYSVGPALANANLATSIWAYDANTDLPSFPQNILTMASKYVNTVAWHCYADSLDWSAMTTFQQANPGVQQIMTECWTPAISGQSDWYHAANFTMGTLQNWASGALAWTLGADPNNGPHMTNGCSYCQGLVTINSATSYTFNMAYYLMAQFSRYIPRGAIILSGTGSTSSPKDLGVQFVSSLNPDNTKTVVILNTLSKDVYLELTLSSSGAQWSGKIPTNSLVTWVLPSS
ncbi:glucan endo-1,6-glucosidase [Lecanosticta acicola]|uniref:glucan endo-1,6-beta-glucosidase n=1 Tax=Lecanosticta acicola TaxID=111012 RepID=A0AAI9EDV5_9PEZI|nr:glucan endo-1,6-glucosidase [Lecanosticta acicola]